MSIAEGVPETRAAARELLLGTVLSGLIVGEAISELDACGIVSIILSFFTRVAKLLLEFSFILSCVWRILVDVTGVIVSNEMLLEQRPISSHVLVWMSNLNVSLVSWVTSRRPPNRNILSLCKLKLCPHRGPGTFPSCSMRSHRIPSRSKRHISLRVSLMLVRPPKRKIELCLVERTILQEVRAQGT